MLTLTSLIHDYTKQILRSLHSPHLILVPDSHIRQERRHSPCIRCPHLLCAPFLVFLLALQSLYPCRSPGNYHLSYINLDPHSCSILAFLSHLRVILVSLSIFGPRPGPFPFVLLTLGISFNIQTFNVNIERFNRGIALSRSSGWDTIWLLPKIPTTICFSGETKCHGN